DAAEDAPGRVPAAGLLQPRVVVDGDVRELGDLLAPQARRAPPVPPGQAHVLGADAFPFAAQEIRQCTSVHTPTVGPPGGLSHGLPVPGCARPARATVR